MSVEIRKRRITKMSHSLSNLFISFYPTKTVGQTVESLDFFFYKKFYSDNVLSLQYKLGPFMREK